jgi:hypothetical protein
VTSDLLRVTARYVFFSALAIAPWFYGGTTSTSIVVINWLLGAALLLWVIELSVNRRWPNFPKWLIALVVALVMIGAWMTLNARFIYDDEFGTFASINNLAPPAPGSFDYALSFAWMVRAALLLGAALFVVDLVRDDKALLQLWAAVAISGGSIALLGLLQKATGAHIIFWQSPIPGYTSTFFGSYYYHGNAGAYLNLILPFTAGLVIRAFGTPSSSGVRSLWRNKIQLNMAALAANTSRMAQLVAALIVIALLVRFGQRIVRGLSRVEKNVALAGTAAILFVLFAVGQASHLDAPIRRWETLGDRVSEDGRWAASRVALSALPKAGLFGSGPGTFRVVFQGYNKTAEHPVEGQWRFLHQDYLQTVLEWGWLGSALWATMFFGGIGVAVASLRRQNALRRSQPPLPQVRAGQGNQFRSGEPVSQRSSVLEFAQGWRWRRRLILTLAIIALMGVALHSIVDFPLQIESIQLYVATCLGLCWGSARWNSGDLGARS